MRSLPSFPFYRWGNWGLESQLKYHMSLTTVCFSMFTKNQMVFGYVLMYLIFPAPKEEWKSPLSTNVWPELGSSCRAQVWHRQSFISVQFSRSVVSDYLQPHGLQHTGPPHPSTTPGACSNSCPSSRGCHPTISSSDVPFSSCLQSFPGSGSFQMSQFFTSGGQSKGVSA